MIEVHVLRESRGIVRRVVLKPDPVELEIRIAPPSESFEWAATRILGENSARPETIGKPLAHVAYLDSVEPDRMLAVRRGHGIVELDHMLHARPPTGRGLYRGVIEEEIPPKPAVSRNVHAHPVVVVIKTVRDVVLLRCRDEPVITNGLEARLRVLVILAARRIFDVVADIERTVDARAQLFVEMAAVIDPATDPRDVERARSGATEGN